MKYLIFFLLLVYSCITGGEESNKSELVELWMLLESNNKLDSGYKELYFHADSVQIFFETNKPLWRAYTKSNDQLNIGVSQYDLTYDLKAGTITSVDKKGNKDVFVVSKLEDVKYNSFLYNAIKFNSSNSIENEIFDEEVSSSNH